MLVSGLYLPLVTPFATDGSVDLEALERLARELIDAGADGLVALGSTAEPFALSRAETDAVVDVLSRVCVATGVDLIVGAGTVDTSETIARHEALASAPGVTASLAVVPYYMRPSAAGVVAHFEAVASRSPVPLLVYNVPYRTGVTLDAQALLAIASIDGGAGMKQSAGVIDDDVVEFMAHRPDDFAVLCGDDALIQPLVAMGGAGSITASAHFATEAWARLARDASRHDTRTLVPLARALFAEPNPAVIKALLFRQGRIATPDVRMPMTPASPAAVDRAAAALESAMTPA